jgi:OOP family OmpA-OmpF porin
MKTSFNRKHLSLAVACALALGFASNAARAQMASAPEQSRAEVADRSLVKATGGQVWRNGFGECWHAGFGPAPLPGAECNPQPIAQYIAPAPAPAPYVAPVVVAAAAPQPIYDKVILDANVLFDFDKSVLRPAGRDTLDSFVGSIKGMDSSAIRAIGYADRLGTDTYNQALSERRVATVKEYLATKGIDMTSVQTSGKGEMEPTTAAGTCTGEQTASNIACLQPDRHVFIEISGSKLRQ